MAFNFFFSDLLSSVIKLSFSLAAFITYSWGSVFSCSTVIYPHEVFFVFILLWSFLGYGLLSIINLQNPSTMLFSSRSGHPFHCLDSFTLCHICLMVVSELFTPLSHCVSVLKCDFDFSSSPLSLPFAVCKLLLKYPVISCARDCDF